MCQPGEDANLPGVKVFIVSWVDYCNKYGMGYALTDGSVGVHFNDSTSIVLAPNRLCVDKFCIRFSTSMCADGFDVGTWNTSHRGTMAQRTSGSRTRHRSTQMF